MTHEVGRAGRVGSPRISLRGGGEEARPLPRGGPGEMYVHQIFPMPPSYSSPPREVPMPPMYPPPSPPPPRHGPHGRKATVTLNRE